MVTMNITVKGIDEEQCYVNLSSLIQCLQTTVQNTSRILERSHWSCKVQAVKYPDPSSPELWDSECPTEDRDQT